MAAAKKKNRTGSPDQDNDRLNGVKPLLNKHQLKTEGTTRKLLRSAFRVFTRDGFEAARIDDIAVEAGYTRGAFYAHFASKEALFFALLEEQSCKLRDVIAKATIDCGDEQARWHALRDYYVHKACDRKWTILLLEFKLYALRRPQSRAKLAAEYRSIRANMKRGEVGTTLRSQPDWSSEWQEAVRIALQCLLHGLVIERAYDPSSLSEKHMTTLLERFFDYSIPKPAAELREK